jgi:ABC-2 type transport system ATP-binding protein
MIALESNQIVKYFQKKNETAWALKRVNLQIQQGEIFGLLGPNGSGKSTFIRIASTLLIPDEGTMSVFGLDVVKQAKQVQELINRVSVEASFFRMLSPMENLLFSSGIYGLPKKAAIQRIYEIIDLIGLERKRMHDRIKDFSRGMQQKVAIARAFLTNPPLMLLDEPTTGLDPRAKREVQQLVSDMNTKHGMTILLTTHDMDEAERLCNRVAIIHKGEIVVSGTPGHLIQIQESKTPNPTLEDVFMAYTGLTFSQVETEEEVAVS